MADAEFIGAIVALVVFYVIIVVVGIFSSIYFKRKYNVDSSDMDFQIVAGRKLGSVVGWLTMSGNLEINSYITHSNECDSPQHSQFGVPFYNSQFIKYGL